VKILLVDDHALFRAGLVHVLRQLDSDAQIIEAGNCAQALAAAATNTDLSLVLLDLHMPDGNGLVTLDTLKERYPGLVMVVLSASESRQDMQNAIKKGALGFIPKSETPEVMLSALRLVIAGGVYVPPQLIDRKPDQQNPQDDKASPNLTPRQLQVLALAIDGKPYKIIARELGLAEPTVKTHLIAAFRALGVSNRMQAARKVQELKLQFPTS